MPANTTPKKIIDRLVLGLRNKLTLMESQVYPSIAPIYVDGQPDRVIQVVHGSTRPDGRGQGAQEGGVLIRRQTIRLTIWWRVHFDPRNMSRELLIRESEGMLDFCEGINDAVQMTFLGTSVLIEPLFNEGETENQWFDMQKGIVRRDLMLSGPFVKAMPTAVTMTETDVTVEA